LKELAQTGLRTLPSWLEFNVTALEGRILALPAREEIDVPVSEQLIVEHYSR
jgi:small subunit ribosomal protein S4